MRISEWRIARSYSGAIAGSMLALLLLVSAAAAQERFPARPIELIVPYPPGGGGDVVARLLADAAEPILGQEVVVLNKAGAAGTLGHDLIAQAKPDGYTIGLIVNLPMVITPHVLKVNYTPRDFAAMTQLTEGQIVFCARSDFPAQNATELIAYVKKNPGKLTYAGDGLGGSAQVLGERVFQALDVKLRLVPFGGAGESLKALLGGHVDLYGGSVPPVLPHVAAGKVRCLLLTSKDRTETLPGVMAASDLGVPERGSSIWHGIAGPAGIPPERIAVLERAFREAAQQDKVKTRLQAMGLRAVASSREEFTEAIQAQYEAFKQVVERLGLQQK